MDSEIKHHVKSVQIRSFFLSVFSLFGLNTEIYCVNLQIQFEYRKIWTIKTPYLDTFHTVKSDLRVRVKWGRNQLVNFNAKNRSSVEYSFKVKKLISKVKPWSSETQYPHKVLFHFFVKLPIWQFPQEFEKLRTSNKSRTLFS